MIFSTKPKECGTTCKGWMGQLCSGCEFHKAHSQNETQTHCKPK